MIRLSQLYRQWCVEQVLIINSHIGVDLETGATLKKDWTGKSLEADALETAQCGWQAEEERHTKTQVDTARLDDYTKGLPEGAGT